MQTVTLTFDLVLGSLHATNLVSKQFEIPPCTTNLFAIYEQPLNGALNKVYVRNMSFTLELATCFLHSIHCLFMIIVYAK